MASPGGGCIVPPPQPTSAQATAMSAAGRGDEDERAHQLARRRRPSSMSAATTSRPARPTYWRDARPPMVTPQPLPPSAFEMLAVLSTTTSGLPSSRRISMRCDDGPPGGVKLAVPLVPGAVGIVDHPAGLGAQRRRAC